MTGVEIALVAGLAIQGGAYAAGAITLSAFAVGAALAVSSYAVTKFTTKQIGFQQEKSSLQVSQKGDILPRKIVYGTVRIGGNFLYSDVGKVYQYSYLNDGAYEPYYDVYNVSRTDNNVLRAKVVSENGFYHNVLELACHELTKIHTVFLNDLIYQDDFYDIQDNINGFKKPQDINNYYNVQGCIIVEAKLGEPNQTPFYRLPLARQYENDNIKWTSECIGKSTAMIYVGMRYIAEKFKNGIPEITALVDGKKVYDPRTGTWVFSNNWALVVADYITNTDFGLSKETPVEVDWDLVKIEANICDEAVFTPQQAVASQKRYTIDGAFVLDQPRIDILNKMMTSAGGMWAETGGKIIFKCARAEPSTFSITKDMILSAVRYTSKPSLENIANTIQGSYIDKFDLYTSKDYPAYINQNYFNEDGVEFKINYDFYCTTDKYACQRLAQIALNKTRLAPPFEIYLNLNGLNITVLDVIDITLPILGWVNKKFRVLEWSFSMYSDEYAVKLILQEENDSVYAINNLALTEITGETNTGNVSKISNLPQNITVVKNFNQNGTGQYGGFGELCYLIGFNASESYFVTGYKLIFYLSDGTKKTYQIDKDDFVDIGFYDLYKVKVSIAEYPNYTFDLKSLYVKVAPALASSIIKLEVYSVLIGNLISENKQTINLNLIKFTTPPVPTINSNNYFQAFFVASFIENEQKYIAFSFKCGIENDMFIGNAPITSISVVYRKINKTNFAQIGSAISLNFSYNNATEGFLKQIVQKFAVDSDSQYIFEFTSNQGHKSILHTLT